MKKIELSVKTSGKLNAPWFYGYMTIEFDSSLKCIKRYFVRKEEYNINNNEKTITMIREYKTRNALMNFMRKLPNN